MQVDSLYVKAQRQQRGWSQQHLAEVTDLGLRTIQRIEETGAASYESARSLAAVFGVEVAQLRATTVAAPRSRVPLRPLLGALAAVLTCGTLLVVTRSFANQVLVTVGVALEAPTEKREWLTRFVVDEDTLVPGVNDLRLEDLRFTIVPKLLPQGPIVMEIQIFERNGEDEVLVSAPRFVVTDGDTAEVVTGNGARKFRFSITPRRHPRSFL